MNEALIRELAEKFGTTVEHLWGVLVRQAIIMGVSDCFFIGLLMVAMLWSYKFIQNKYDDIEWGVGRSELLIVWGIAMIVSTFLIGVLGTSAVTALLNPEYWALNQLFSK
jgi:hypothetical protein